MINGAVFFSYPLAACDCVLGGNKDTEIPRMPCPDFLRCKRLAFSSASHSITRTITQKSDFFTQPSKAGEFTQSMSSRCFA